MSAFDALHRLALRPVQMLTGESAVVRPMMKTGGPNGLSQMDPGRAVVTIPAPDALFDEGVAVVDLSDAWDSRSMARPGHVSSRIRVALSLAQVGYEPRQGDRIERTGTGAVYSVTEVVERNGVTVTLGLALAAD